MSEYVEVEFYVGEHDVDVNLLNRYGDIIPYYDRSVHEILIPSIEDHLKIVSDSIIFDDIPEENLIKTVVITYIYEIDSFSYETGRPCIETSGRNLTYISGSVANRLLNDKVKDVYDIIVGGKITPQYLNLSTVNFKKLEIQNSHNEYCKITKIFNSNLDLESKRLKILNNSGFVELSDDYESIVFDIIHNNEFDSIYPKVKEIGCRVYDDKIFKHFPNIERIICSLIPRFRDDIKHKLESMSVTVYDLLYSRLLMNHNLKEAMNFKCAELKVKHHPIFNDDRITHRIIEYLDVSNRIILENICLNKGDKRLKHLTIQIDKKSQAKSARN